MTPPPPHAMEIPKAMQPQVVRPCKTKGKTVSQTKPAKKQDHKKLKNQAPAIPTEDTTTSSMTISLNHLLNSAGRSTQATETTWSPSRTNGSMLSEMQSPDATPCANPHRGYPQNNKNNKDLISKLTACCDHDAEHGVPTPASHRVTMVPMTMMVPVMAPRVNESRKEMQPRVPQVVMPNNAKVETANQVSNDHQQDFKKLNISQAISTEEVTTLMIRGIPCNFSQEALLAKIDEAGLKGKYNFFYLPKDGSKGSNLGYAFINFVDQQCAELCTSTFKGVPLAPARSLKTLKISPADIQGLPSLWKHFRSTAVSQSSRGPMFLQV
jgi:hypothetical protein